MDVWTPIVAEPRTVVCWSPQQAQPLPEVDEERAAELTLLADRWVRQRGGQAWALTVDHQLRAESGEEARAVVRECRRVEAR